MRWDIIQMKNKFKIGLFESIMISILILTLSFIFILFLSNIIYINYSDFVETLTRSEIIQAFFLSLYTSIISAILSVLIAVPVAYVLSRQKGFFISFADTVIDLLIVLPVIVVGLSILVLFSIIPEAEIGEDISWFHNFFLSIQNQIRSFFIYKKAGIVLAQTVCSFSFAVRAIKASFDSIDRKTEKTAMTQGCTPAQTFFRVTLPMAKQGIAAGAVLACARAYGIFGAISVIAGAMEGRTLVLPTTVYLEITVGNLEQALSISLLMIMTALIILSILRIIFKSNIFGYSKND